MGDVDWHLTLEYVKVLLSWPPLAALLLILFLKRFHKEIGTFLTNIRPKGPGFEPAFAQQIIDTPTPPDEEAALADAAQAAANAADYAIAELEQAEKEESFRYLNHLLVYVSQWLLNFLVTYRTITVAEFNDSFPELDANNRQAVLTVLYQHGLIHVVNNGIHITAKGDEYARWPERIAWVNVMRDNLELPRNALTGRLRTSPSRPIEQSHPHTTRGRGLFGGSGTHSDGHDRHGTKGKAAKGLLDALQDGPVD